MPDNSKKNPPTPSSNRDEKVTDLPNRKPEQKDDKVKGGGKANFQDISIT